MKTIAVTGSSGFIGKHLVMALQKNAFQVVELDYEKGFDLLMSDDINKVPPFNTIIHLAAKSFVPMSFEVPRKFYYDNYVVTLNVLELAKKNKANVVYFSTYLYGEPEYLPIDEKHPIKPHNPYAQSKLICEKLCEGYVRDFNIPIIIFRPFNIYGKGQNSSFLIPMIIDQLKTGVISLKDPRPKRDFIHVDDVVNAVLFAVDYDKSAFEIFNLGFGKSYSIRETVAIIQEISKLPVSIHFSNEIRPGEVLDTVASTKKFENFFNWQPTISLENGINDFFKATINY